MHTVKVVLGISVPFLLLTLWGILDAARREFGSVGRKAAWMITAAIPFIGWLVYLIFGLRKGKKPVRS